MANSTEHKKWDFPQGFNYGEIISVLLPAAQIHSLLWALIEITRAKAMQLTSLVALWLACLLHSPGSRSQIIFQDAGYTTPAYTNAIGNIANFSPFIVNNGGLPGICFCVNNQRCDSAGGGNPSNGAGVIDIRIVNVSRFKVAENNSEKSFAQRPQVVSQLE